MRKLIGINGSLKILSTNDEDDVKLDACVLFIINYLYDEVL